MNFTFEIAKRYLLGKKSTSAINIIAWISVIGITIGTAALILILSVFNGFENLLSGLYNAFNPDMKITLVEGKFFEVDDDTYSDLKKISGIAEVAMTVEEVALFEYKGVQKVGTIKGVDKHYSNVTSIDSTLKRGTFILQDDNINFGVLGSGLSSSLSINHKDAFTPISINVPMRKSKGLMSKLGKEFKTENIYPSGVFTVGSDADIQYIITNFEAVNSLLNQKDKISALEIKLDNDADEQAIREAILTTLGDGYQIENRHQQDATFLKVMLIEKWISFLIAVLTLVIIAFNMVGSLWMMVLDKKKDIAILRSMGCDTKDIRRIFFMEGMIITVLGILLGIFTALVLYVLQKYYGLVAIPDGFLVNAYPIDLVWTDFVVVTLSVLCIGGLASLLPSYRAGKVSAFVRQEV